MKKLLAALALSATLFSTAQAVETAPATTETAPAAVAEVAKPGFSITDPSTWTVAVEAPKNLGKTIKVNPASAKFWMGFIDPKSHDDYHAAFSNPAQYAQFMNPAFYAKFADMNAWMEWIKPETYAVLVDSNTYAHYMNPQTYVHNMNYHYYTQAFDTKNYEAYMKPETYGLTPAEGGFNMFNPASWMQQAQIAVSSLTK